MNDWEEMEDDCGETMYVVSPWYSREAKGVITQGLFRAEFCWCTTVGGTLDTGTADTVEEAKLAVEKSLTDAFYASVEAIREERLTSRETGMESAD